MTTRAPTRFIPGDEILAVSDWSFAQVDQKSSKFAAKLAAQALAEEQARDSTVRQAAHAEGFSEGYAKGHAQATQEGNARLDDYVAHEGAQAARQFGQLMANAQEQLQAAEQVMARGVLDLACELARQVLRHELTSNPNALQPVIREALSILSADSKAAVVRMNPLDMDVLAEVIRQEFSGLSLTLLPEPSMLRGGCTIESAGTVVDATVQKRWQRAVARLGLDVAWEVSDASST